MNEPEILKEVGSAFYLTPSGHARLQSELEFLTTVKRPEIADRLRESQGHGEFSEDNSELDEVKSEQSMVENRIAELRTVFGNVHIIEDHQIPTNVVGLGSLVTVLDLDWDDQYEIRIVSSIEADPAENLISVESPMGQAIFGHGAGEEVLFTAPEGKKRYKVVAISK